MEKPRFFLKLEISPQVRRRFQALYEKRGLSQVEAATRLFAWFLDQDEMVQQAIFQQLPSRLAEHARKMMIEGIVPVTIPDETTPPAEEPMLPQSHPSSMESEIRKQAIGMVDAQAKKEADQKGRKRAG